MDRKEIKIEAGLEPKLGPRFDRVMKDIARGMQSGFNAKALKDYNKELDRAVKMMGSMGISMDRVAKITRDRMNKGFDESTKALKTLQTEIKNVERLQSGGFARVAAGVRRQWASEGKHWDTMSSEERETYRAQISSRHERYQNALQAKAGALTQVGMDYAQNEQMQDMATKNAMFGKILAGAQVAQAGISFATGVSQGLYNQEGLKLNYSAREAGLRNSLFDKTASGGGFLEALALLKNGNQIDAIRAKAQKAYEAGQMGQIGQGATQTAVGVGTLAYGGPTAGAIGNAAGNIGGGMSNVLDPAISGVHGIWAAGGDAAQSAMSATIAAESPWMRRAAESIESSGIQRTKLYRRLGGQQAYLYRAQQAAANMYGDEWDAQQLGSGMGAIGGNTMANQNIAGAMRMSRNSGVDASLAGSTLMQMQMGAGWNDSVYFDPKTGKGRGEDALERIIGKGFARGIKDTQLKEVLVEAAGGVAYGHGGRRFVGDGAMDIALSGMDRPDMIGVKNAVGGYQMLNQLMGSGNGYLGARGFLHAGNALGAGGSTFQQIGLGRATLEDLINPSQQLQDLGVGGKVQKVISNRMEDFMSLNPKLGSEVRRLMKDKKMSKSEALELIASSPEYTQLRGETATAYSELTGADYGKSLSAATMTMHVASGKYQGLSGDKLRAAIEQDKTAVIGGTENTADAAAMQAKLENQLKTLQAVADPRNLATLQAVAEGTTKILEAAGRAGTDPAQVLKGAAEAMEQLAAAAQKFSDVVGQSPALQMGMVIQ